MNWALPEADRYFRPILAKDPRGFEIDHLEMALKHCRQFRTAVDGGAHVGTWSAAMALRFKKVMAFEPAPDTFECLAENVQGIANVSKFMLALGATQCSGRISDDPSRPGNTGARHLNVSCPGAVQIVPLDDFNLLDLDFLKLDVEGYELHALTGAAATLHRCKPVVLIECKKFKPARFGVDAEAAASFLNSTGYREIARVRNDRVFVAEG